MNFTIRRLQKADREGWEKAWQAYLVFYKASVPADVTDVTWERLLNDREDPQGYVAVDNEDEVIVGMAHYHYHRTTWAKGPYCYLQDLFVFPEARGVGVGRALIKAVYEAAETAGAVQVYWLTQEGNAQARILYDQIGTLTDFIKYKHIPGSS